MAIPHKRQTKDSQGERQCCCTVKLINVLMFLITQTNQLYMLTAMETDSTRDRSSRLSSRGIGAWSRLAWRVTGASI